MNAIIYTIILQIKNISFLLSPIIPTATNKVLNTININEEDVKIANITNLNLINHIKELKNIEILFTKVDNDN